MKLILSVEKSINIFVIICIAIILCNDLWWAFVPELFIGGGKIVNLIYTIAMGYLVSYIFYLVVVRYKELKDEKHINFIVIPLLEEIIKSQNLINNCIGSTEANLNKFDVNDKNSYGSSFSNIKYSDVIPRTEGTFLYTSLEWVDFLIEQKKLAKRTIQRLFAFIPHLEPELVQIITSLENSDFYISLIFANQLSSEHKNQDMKNMSEGYYNYQQTIEKLIVYVNQRKAP